MTQITVGITGPNGFIATHLAQRLKADSGVRVATCSRAAFGDPDALSGFVRQCHTVVHLAGMNRGDDQTVYDVNVGLAGRLATSLATCPTPPHVVFASSTQRDRDDAYGRSKRAAEDRLTQWAKQAGGSLSVLVIPNVYGPGCRPFYNSVVATFCHQLAHGGQPVVLEDREVEFIWINDLVKRLWQTVHERPAGVEVVHVGGTARITVSQLLSKLEAFRRSYFEDRIVARPCDALEASLYTTFLSHVELEDHRHRPQVHADDRGRLFEIIRLAGGGQVFFSTTKPGVIRGDHFHTRKFEWFCVLRGEAAIRLRRVGDDRVREFRVSGDAPEFISIPAMHTHHIENVGDEDLLTMFWCNEIFEPADPDTFYERVA